ncbi:hypothetical protein NVP1104O_88 [Vibrio phage 1.104.O._10N.286.49.A12]|nr:hypothetical protein NVP1104O_88 [Vibrio phage 1.104.O._10N.286.49.A12]
MIGEFIKEKIVIIPNGHLASWYDICADYLEYCDEYDMTPESFGELERILKRKHLMRRKEDRVEGVATLLRRTIIRNGSPSELQFMQDYLMIEEGAVTPTSEVYYAYDPDGNGALTQSVLTRQVTTAFKGRVDKKVRTIDGARCNCFINLKVM